MAVKAVSLSDLLKEVRIPSWELDKCVSNDHLLSVSLFLPSWKTVAPFLQLDEADIGVIDADGRGEEKRLKMLRKWRDKCAFKATYRMLVDALLRLGMTGYAERVCRLLTPWQPAEPSVSQLMEDLADVSDWFGLGLHLGLSASQLNAIEMDTPAGVGSTQRRKARVLATWMKSHLQMPSWRDIVSVLCDMGEYSIVEGMERKYSGSMAATGKDRGSFASIASTRANVEELKRKWARLYATVCRKLSQDSKIVVRDVSLYICGQVSIEIPDEADFYKIFQILQIKKRWDFWNCNLLLNIVSEYLPHDEELSQLIKKYQSELEYFKKSTVVADFIAIIDSELSPHVSDFDNHYQSYSFKIDVDPKKTTLKDVENSWEAQINQYALPDLQKGLLRMIASSSILVTYLIPAKMVPTVVERVRACTSKFFKQQRILCIAVGEEIVFIESKSPAAELRKKALAQTRFRAAETRPLGAEVQRLSVQQMPTLPQTSSQSSAGLSPHTKMQWRRGTNAPEGISGAQAVVMGEKVYMESDYEVYQYDWRCDTWSTLPDCPSVFFGMAQLASKLIAVGGEDMMGFVTGKVYQFAEQAQQWEEFLPPGIPTARSSLTVVTRSSGSPAIAACGGLDARHRPVDIVEVYSFASSQWHTAEPLPIPCYEMSSVTIDGTCYFLGGVNSVYSGTECCFSVPLNSLIDSATSPHSQLDDPIWMSVSDTPLTWSTAASLRGSLIAIGGVDTTTDTTSSAIHVHTSEGLWERVKGGDLPEPCFGSTAVCLPSGGLLVAGGHDGNDWKRTIFVAFFVD